EVAKLGTGLILSRSLGFAPKAGLFAHEALAGGADQRDRLREEDPHRVAQREGLLVGAPGHLDAGERRGRQLDGRVQRQRRELLALSLRDRLRLLLRELA